MEKKGICTIEKAFKKYKGEGATISIFHKLYGDQKIKCKLNYIFDDERIGFKANEDHEIFVYRNEIVDYGIKDGIYFADNVMKIYIKFD